MNRQREALAAAPIRSRRESAAVDDSAIGGREMMLLLMLASVQFTSIVDFMVVMPLGPQLMRTLEITPVAVRLDRLVLHDQRGDRRDLRRVVHGPVRPQGGVPDAVLRASWSGRSCAAWPGATRLLLAARVVTGAFGGILGGMALAIVGDVFPEQQARAGDRAS